jgi:CubicO group peptidase (beta-lactamase class C family)
VTRLRIVAGLVVAAIIGAAGILLLAGGDDSPREFAPPASVADLAGRIERAVPPALQEGHVPGAAVAVVRGGRVAWTHGFGVADARTRAPVTAKTVFQVASLSKPVTAWGAVRGVLPLDEPLRDILRPWPLPRSDRDARGITVRRLLSHTAGLSVDGYLGHDPSRPLPTTLASLRGDSAGAGAVRLVDEPGAGYRYSGGGYTLLQYAIEQRTGEGFGAWARTAILRPLGMNASEFGWPPRRREPAAAGHDARGRPDPGYRYAELAAGGLASTAADMGRFVAAVVRRPAPLGTPQPGTGGQYGLGLHVERLAGGLTLLSHEGVNRGWHARLLALPGRGWGAVVLTNGDGGGGVADAVERILVR